MNNDYFVNIEDRDMPSCEFNYPDLEVKEKSNAGFVNFIYLFSFVVTAVMWGLLIFFRK